jgi:hypothetical protein
MFMPWLKDIISSKDESEIFYLRFLNLHLINLNRINRYIKSLIGS